MKNLTHTIRDLLEGKTQDPNKEDLAKLKAVAKMKDEKDVEEKLDEVLEYGTQQAAAQYAKDTPGQDPGHTPDPVQHQHKPNLAVDGVPVPGGQIKKPNFDKDAGMGKVTAKEETDIDSLLDSLTEEQLDEISAKLARKAAAASGAKSFEYSSSAYGPGADKESDRLEKKADKARAYIQKRQGDKGSNKVDRLTNKLVFGKSRMESTEEAMNGILDSLIEKYGLQEAMSAAERQARKDAAKEYGKPKVDPADVDHDYKPEKKRGRGERDLPHITTQLRGVVDMGTKHSGVKFKDGKTVKVHPDHAKSWLAKHDSAKPAHKLAMYKSHDSHSEFMKHK